MSARDEASAPRAGGADGAGAGVPGLAMAGRAVRDDLPLLLHEARFPRIQINSRMGQLEIRKRNH